MKATRNPITAEDLERLQVGDYVHDVPSAARRAKVSDDILRLWITQGMRAMPLNSTSKRTQWRIRDCWLLAWLEKRADDHANEVARARAKAEADAQGKVMKAKGRAVRAACSPGAKMDLTDPIGPIDWSKRR